MDIIFWFSGTGNSRAITNALVAELGNAEAVPLATATPEMLHGRERIGFVFPVYAFGMPNLVANFLATFPERLPAAYVFTVANSGGMPGAPHAQARGILKGRGVALAAGWSLVMPGNYTPFYGAPSEVKQRRLFEKTESRIPRIAAGIKAKTRAVFEDSFPPVNWLASLIHPLAVRNMKTEDKGFRAKDNCTHCGTCVKVCPVGNIRLDMGRPEWLGHCEQCMACLQWCPVEAIEFGKRTAGRKRYRHPDFKASDFFLGKQPPGAEVFHEALPTRVMEPKS